MPAEEAQLASVDGDTDRYDAELRPELMRRAIAELQDAGVEPDIWKIEGVDETADCERIAEQCRAGGRDGVVCVVLGRGADDDKVDHWLRAGAPVEAYVGFAIGRSIWGAPLRGFLDGDLAREDAARADRRQLPALRQGLPGGREGPGRLARGGARPAAPTPRLGA